MNLIVYFLGLKIVQFIMSIIPNNNYNSFESFLEVGSHVLNIFAWVNQFIPTDLLLLVIACTTTMIVSKFLYRLLMKIAGNLK